LVISENAASGTDKSSEGFSLVNIAFPSFTEQNFENSSGFGAQGWVVKPEGFDPDLDNLDSDTNYIDANMADDEDIEVEDEDNDEVVNKQDNGDSDDEENVVQEKLFASFFSDFDAEEVPNQSTDDSWTD
jgi:hypothetical protein